MKKRINEKSFADIELPVAITAPDKGKDIYVQQNSIREGETVSEIRHFHLDGKSFDEVAYGTAPRISPDGKWLAYVDGHKNNGRDRNRQMQQSLLILRNTETKKETILGSYLRIAEIIWSKSGRLLAFTSAVEAQHDPSDLISLEKAVWIDRVKFKTDGIGIFDGTYRQVTVIDIRTGTSCKIDEGKRDLYEPVFVDENRLAYLGIPDNPDNSDYYHVYLRHLTENNVRKYPGPGGPVGHPAVSHDRKKIACIAHDNEFWEATNFRIYLLDLESGEWSCITKKYDRSIGNYVINDIGYDRNQYTLEWDAADENIFSLITDGYGTNLYKISVSDGAVVPIASDKAVIFAFKILEQGIAAVCSGEQSASELILIQENQPTQMLWRDSLNADGFKLTKSKSFYYDGADQSIREALYYPPVGALKGTVLNIHGGPHYCHGYDFSFDIQLLAANGYGTIICNPAGSQGGGEELAKASYHDWGGKDYQELMNCMDTAEKTFHLKKVPSAVMGGSYGGFMTNWIIGHTDRFSCAFSERSTCNRYSQAGTSDCAFRYGMYEFDGLAWENPKYYMEHSPISYVKNVNAPVLLIHGDQDMNCPITQSEEWYSALKLEGKAAYLAVFPGQYHNLTGKGNPVCRLERYRLLTWWLKRYLEVSSNNE